MVERGDVLNVVKGLKGASYGEIMGIFPEEPSHLFDVHLEELIKAGLITHLNGVYYPIVRSIVIIPKGQNETVDEIELKGLTAKEIKEVFKPKVDDPLFFDGYRIDERKTAFFERFGIKFDFSQLEYYLICGFDNSRTFHNRS